VHVKTTHQNESAADRPNHPLRIVLLDDEPQVRAAHRIMIQFRFADAVIIECEDGDEAWKILQASPPDLFITDLTHLGLRVEEMLKRLDEVQIQFPILVVSAFHEGLDLLREQHQANPQLPRGFLDKPFTAAALHAEIERLIDARATGR
jgi:DNA-binding NarL/FixJ family response regulator